MAAILCVDYEQTKLWTSLVDGRLARLSEKSHLRGVRGRGGTKVAFLWRQIVLESVSVDHLCLAYWYCWVEEGRKV